MVYLRDGHLMNTSRKGRRRVKRRISRLLRRLHRHRRLLRSEEGRQVDRNRRLLKMHQMTRVEDRHGKISQRLGSRGDQYRSRDRREQFSHDKEPASGLPQKITCSLNVEKLGVVRAEDHGKTSLAKLMVSMYATLYKYSGIISARGEQSDLVGQISIATQQKICNHYAPIEQHQLKHQTRLQQSMNHTFPPSASQFPILPIPSNNKFFFSLNTTLPKKQIQPRTKTPST